METALIYGASNVAGKSERAPKRCVDFAAQPKKKYNTLNYHNKLTWHSLC